jgi:hypothetical protein
MRRTQAGWWLPAVAMLVLVIGTGCSKQETDFADTSVSAIDSTLALGDVPEPDMTADEYQEQTTPPPTPAPAPKKTTPPPPKPAPAQPKPAPPAEATLAVGTVLNMTLDTELTTKTAVAGDRFVATLSEPILVGNRVAVPAGAVVHGHVASSQQPGKLSGRGMMVLAFDELEFEGRRYNVTSVGDSIWGGSGAGKDAAMVGGGAAAGAVLGKVLGGSAAKGAVIGGAAGVATSLLTRGPQLEMKAGTPINVELEQTVTVLLPPLDGGTSTQ